MLYIITWLTDFAVFIFIFSVTRFLSERNAVPFMLGGLGAAYFLASAISSACCGSCADRWGHRRVAIVGMSLFTISLGAVSFGSLEYWLICTSHVCVGIAVGMVYPSIMALLGHGRSGQRASRRYLLFCLAFNLGIISGQITGGWSFDRYGVQASLLIALMLMPVNLICLVQLKEPINDGDSTINDVADGSSHTSLSQAFARLAWIANFGGMFSMSMVWFLLPPLMVSLEIAADHHGVILAIGRIVIMCSYVVMHCTRFWRHDFRITGMAQAFGASGLLILSMANTPTGLIIGIAGLSAMIGYNYFASLFYNATGNGYERQGRAFGLNEASLGLGAAGGSLIGGLAAGKMGSRAPFQIAAVLVAILLIVQSLVWWKAVRPLSKLTPARN